MHHAKTEVLSINVNEDEQNLVIILSEKNDVVKRLELSPELKKDAVLEEVIVSITLILLEQEPAKPFCFIVVTFRVIFHCWFCLSKRPKQSLDENKRLFKIVISIKLIINISI